jgi:hypothetical protein
MVDDNDGESVGARRKLVENTRDRAPALHPEVIPRPRSIEA